MDMTPTELQKKINRISDEIFKVSQEMAVLAEKSGTVWLELRKDCKTNTEADRLYDATPDGSRRAYIKYYLRGLQSKRGAYVLEQRANYNL